MMDKFRIDSHKLLYHVDRVGEWLKGKLVYPIYMEVSPSGACNHRCSFCGLDFMQYKNQFLIWSVFKHRLAEFAALGVKSIMYGGEGEPLLHKNINELIMYGRSCGLDIAITTNGVLLKPELAREIMPHTEWIKVSLNAGTRETYGRIHGTREHDYETVLSNLSTAAEIKRLNGLRCVLGIQMLLLPENRDETLALASTARDIGVDYLVVKPYSQHPLSKTKRYRDVKYCDDYELGHKLREFNCESFQVVFRFATMEKWDEPQRSYKRCLALPFWSYIDSGGNVWGCSCYLGDERFLFGNLYENTFQEIWEGERRRKSLSWVATEMDTTRCRVNCRMDEINTYLWELKHPPEHVNFI